jgi:4-amino-4-deoxy-L-arabinose transferase-like glycosyltransferase
MKRTPLFYLTLITIFAAVTRIWFFWKDGLHTDELFTFNLVVPNDLWYIIQWSLTHDCNPPLFYVIDKLSIMAFGATRFAERLPAVLSGIALIPAVYYFGRELKGETLGLFAALAAATSGPLWYYSQFGRAYMPECFIFTVLCIFWIRLVRGDAAKANWYWVTGLAVILAWMHLVSIIPLTCMFLWLLWQYRVESLKWLGLTFLLSSPLLILMNAMAHWRFEGIAPQHVDWYGGTFNQLVIFAPLEFFGYSFVFWIPMIVYSWWKNWRVKEISILMVTFLITFAAILAAESVTPVYLRYMMLLVPVVMTIGLLPVAEFVDSPEFNRAQKWFVIGSFSVFYFGIIFYAFWTGLYLPKGPYMVG